MLIQETRSQLPDDYSGPIDLVIHARPLKYELAFSCEESAIPLTTLGEITTASLTHRKSGKESPNTGSHFALYAHGAYGMPCRDAAIFSFAEWTAV